MRGKIFAIVLIGILLTCSIAVNAEIISKKSEELNKSSTAADWTIMVYLDGDNDLETHAIDDFLEMSEVGSTDDVNIIVQFDRTPYYDTRYGNWETTKRYRVTYGMVPDAASALQDIGEANCGDPQTVINFAQWAMSNYPAYKYSFIFWDHGSGWKPLGSTGRKYVCFDGTNGDALELAEIRNAFSTITYSGANKIDLVGFDACLMGMIEVGYEIYQYAEYMTASEESEPVTGWDYEYSLDALVDDPSMSAEDLGGEFVNYYSGYDITLSTVDLGNYVYLGYLVSDLAQSLQFPHYKDEIQSILYDVQSYDDYDYVDLYHFAELVTYEFEDENIKNKAQSVMYEVNNAVTSEKHDSYNPNSHGISIYAPYYEYDIEYGTLLFAQYTQWDEFMHWYHGGNPHSNPPSNPIIEGPINGSYGIEYTFTFTSIDVDGDDIFYYVEWGDYSSGEWSDQLPSGTEWETYHTWQDTGAFVIKAKAMDVNGAESGWSTWTITMPRSKPMNLLERLLNHFPILKQVFQGRLFNILLNL